MTLANFNSNFNWQYRMLKEAAECCGIVPDLPPPTACYCYTITRVEGSCAVSYKDCAGIDQTVLIERGNDIVYICAQEGSVSPACIVPGNSVTVTGGTVVCDDTLACQPLCFYYIALGDYFNNSFFPIFQNWQLTNSLGTYEPYGFPTNWTSITGNQVFTNNSYANTAPNSIAWIWAIAPAPPEILTGVDALGNDISYLLSWNGICAAPACFYTEVDITGSPLVNEIQTAASTSFQQGFQGIDLTDPLTSTSSLTSMIQLFYGPATSIIVTDLGGNLRGITINNLYSNTTVNITLQDFTFWSFTEIPCP